LKSDFPRDVFADTSFWFAALERADANHGRAGNLLERAQTVRTRFHATREIVGETLTLLRYRSGARSALAFLNAIVPTLEVILPDASTHQAATEVFRRLAPRARLSYCDALSFVVVRSVLDDMPCLAFDRDFRALGLTVLLS
jgi:predicted nucleic acid-binding protein